ncbi:hypothetical protein Cantr_06796 [Candida viswanathii]|uniref:Uncharacterized protein n=1 Tax=Candida viswanathii TaxID=5486 RepID=A0A367XUG1_9ASCO|nr:hypothetical protein Cantr_06796 [Candida viswanathii]
MLRRDATTIKLSPEDILEYDESIEQQKQRQQQTIQQQLQDHRNPSDFTPHNILQEQINNSSHDIMSDYKEESSSILQRSRITQQPSRDERIGIQRS